MTLHESRRGAFVISTERSRIDVSLVHGFLRTAYWSPGVPLDVVQRAIDHSLAFGVYNTTQQVGFGRIVTDYTTFAYLADVFILEPYRGEGLGKWLVETMLAHPELQGLRRWLLATQDAHELYRQCGFAPLNKPERFMERWTPNRYQQSESKEG